MLSPAQKVAIEILVGLCTSCKEAPTLSQLLRDYTEMEGKQFDYTGFRSIVDLLQASDRFYIFNRAGMWIVNAKLEAESAHIALLVGKQKSNRKNTRGRGTGMPARDGLFYHAAAPRKRYTPQYNARSRGGGFVQSTQRSYQPQYFGGSVTNNNRSLPKRPTVNITYGTPGRVVVQRQNSYSAPLPSQLAKMVYSVPNTAPPAKTGFNFAAYKPVMSQSSAPLPSQMAKVVYSVQNTAPTKPATFQGSAPLPSQLAKVVQQQPTVQKTTAAKPPGCQLSVPSRQVPQKPLPKVIVQKQPPSIPFSNLHATKSGPPASQPTSIVKIPLTVDPPKQQVAIPAKDENISSTRPKSESFSDIRLLPSTSNQVNSENRASRLNSVDQNMYFKKAIQNLPINPQLKRDPTASKYSVQERLNQIKLSVSQEIHIPTPPAPIFKKPEENSMDSPVVIPMEWWTTGEMSNEQRLSQYCILKRLPAPDFKCIPVKDGKCIKFQCRCTINGLTYSTYPDDFDTREQSCDVCAFKAIENIKNEELLSQYPTYSGDSYQVAAKIFDIVNYYKTGVFIKEIPNLFRSKYNFSIPPNYIQIMTGEFDRWFVFEQHLTLNKEIVYPGQRDITTSLSDPPSRESDATDISILPPRITLPWHESNWNVIVTFPEKTSSVWVNLLGPDYYDALIELADKINTVSVLEKPENIMLDECYIAVVHDIRQRVRTIEQDGNKYLVHFIDTGEHELLNKHDLFECDASFLELPPQAVPLSLKGLSLLDNVEDIDYYISDINEQVLVADLHTTKDQYKNNGNVIEVTLFDTSSADDINVNDHLMAKIGELFINPTQLVEKTCNTVVVSCVLDSGIIVGYLKCNGYIDLIKKDIRRIVAGKSNLEKYSGISNEKDKDEMYLVWNRASSQYLRAKVVSFTNIASLNEVIVHLIDYGTFLAVDKRSEIFQLKELSKSLTVFPPQAIRMRLHDVPNIQNPHTVSLLRGYLKTDSIVLVRVIEQDTEPLVLIYCHLNNNKLTCLNEDIKAQAGLY